VKRAAALITGGTSGIGAAYAEAFAARGYDLILVGLESGKSVHAMMKTLENAFGVRVAAVRADLSKEREIRAIIRLALKRGEIEVLVNCAGFGLGADFTGAGLRRENEMLKVHCLAPMDLMRSLIPRMVERRKGVIINVASLGGFLPMARNSVYGATKAFLISLTESLHLELWGYGIRVQLLAPGFVKTHFHDAVRSAAKRLSRQKRLGWMTPRQVVRCSLKSLEKGRVVCIPGLKYRLLYALCRVVPRNLYYRLCLKVGRK